MWLARGTIPGSAQGLWPTRNLKKNNNLSASCSLEIASGMWLLTLGIYLAVIRNLNVADIQKRSLRKYMAKGFVVQPLLIIATAAWLSLCTQFCRIKGCGGAGCPPTNNFRKTQVTPTNYISSEREFIGESESSKILEKYFDFEILWAFFAK